MYFVHKYEEALQYGGPEEGGWWFNSGYPCWRFGIPFPKALQTLAYKLARYLNDKEDERRERHEQYEFTSVLAHKSKHYCYLVEDHFKSKAFPAERPHYE